MQLLQGKMQEATLSTNHPDGTSFYPKSKQCIQKKAIKYKPHQGLHLSAVPSLVHGSNWLEKQTVRLLLEAVKTTQKSAKEMKFVKALKK